jgi:nitrate reductase molybdenum cofactor assembly chaperone NarJ/NarW
MAGSRETLLMASELLTYPDETLLGHLPDIERGVSSLPRRVRHRLEEFLQHVRTSDLLSLQQEYVSTFDLQGGVILYLTYPRYQDDRARGQALVDLRQRYRAAGLDPDSRELPDYLPMVLEFLGMAEPDAARPVARDYVGTLKGIAATLRAKSSPYHHVMDASVQAVASLLGHSLRGNSSA